ncbi:MAG: hypothetical protein PF541_06555 [Prolixibacteraceae bacterium]|jgi:hypothetical protein|nr:hypothetical protein [Prolixibacteraceae bacterium]
MKKYIFTSLLLCAILIQGYSQNRNHEDFDYDKFKAEKIAYYTEAIELTPTEAEKFWPVYNEFEKKKWELISGHHELERKIQNDLGDLTDQEYIDLSVELATFAITDGNLNVEYNDKFLKILSPKKVVQLYITDVTFRKKLLREYRHRERNDEEKKD